MDPGRNCERNEGSSSFFLHMCSRISGICYHQGMKRSYEIDMCSGPLVPKILQFSIPLMLSGILQLLFNAADIIVVGQFTGSTAMAAVGSTGSLNNLIINIFIGLSLGSSVLMARYYGAKDDKNINELVHTSVLLSFISGAALIIIGIILARPLLSLMGTPYDVIDQAVLYMRIIFIGMPALMTYDFGAGILRAIGDTKRPLAYLFISGIINVFLNLFFVIVFGLGVAGVAIATIISQYTSALLVLRCLMKADTSYKLRLRSLRIVRSKLFQIFRIGIPAGVQGAVFNISNVLIQSSINSFGSIAMAGNTASSNIEGFVYTAMNSLYQASTSFTSQNVGAGNTKRIVKVLLSCLAIVTIVGAALGYIAVAFGDFFLGIYSSDPEVIAYGLERLGIICSTYFLCGLMDTACGSIRGLGYSIAPTIVSLAGACGLRIAWIYTAFRIDHTLFMLYLSYPASWLVTFIVHMICFIVFFRKWKDGTSKRAMIAKAAMR